MRKPLQVVAGGQLGNDAAELAVQVDLRVDDVGEDAAAIFDQRDRGLVARGFDAERYWQLTPPLTATLSLRGEGMLTRSDYSPLVRRSRRRPRTSDSMRSRLVS